MNALPYVLPEEMTLTLVPEEVSFPLAEDNEAAWAAKRFEIFCATGAVVCFTRRWETRDGVAHYRVEKRRRLAVTDAPGGTS